MPEPLTSVGGADSLLFREQTGEAGHGGRQALADKVTGKRVL